MTEAIQDVNPTPQPKILVKFMWDCGRMGVVESVFVTTHEQLAATYGKQVYFGEVLGKHSSIDGVLEEKDIAIVTEDQRFINELISYLGTTVSGHNPLSYLADADEG